MWPRILVFSESIVQSFLQCCCRIVCDCHHDHHRHHHHHHYCWAQFLHSIVQSFYYQLSPYIIFLCQCFHYFSHILEEIKAKEDGCERIKLLQDKINEMRKVYSNLKAEVASIDRKRKRLKKKRGGSFVVLLLLLLLQGSHNLLYGESLKSPWIPSFFEKSLKFCKSP